MAKKKSAKKAAAKKPAAKKPAAKKPAAKKPAAKKPAAKKPAAKKKPATRAPAKKAVARKRPGGKIVGVAAPAPAPEIVDVNPKVFRHGRPYRIGASLRNFSGTRIVSASFSQNHPDAAFTGPDGYELTPNASNPQTLRFNSKSFSWNGAATGSAKLTVTIITGGENPVAKTQPVTHVQPAPFVQPVIYTK